MFYSTIYIYYHYLFASHQLWFRAAIAILLLYAFVIGLLAKVISCCCGMTMHPHSLTANKIKF